MLKDKLHSLIYFPYEEKYRDQLELGMVSLNYKSERVIAWVMLITQIFMILVFTFRPGSIFYSFRRLRYVIAYTVLCAGLLVLLSLHRRAKDNWRLHSRLCISFGVLLSLWIGCISYLDALGDVSIIVYCSFHAAFYFKHPAYFHMHPDQLPGARDSLRAGKCIQHIGKQHFYLCIIHCLCLSYVPRTFDRYLRQDHH